MLGYTRSRVAIMALIAVPIGPFIPQTTGSYVYCVAVFSLEDGVLPQRSAWIVIP